MSITVMKQALEALESLRPKYGWGKGASQEAALTNLRQAIEQAERKQADSSEALTLLSLVFNAWENGTECYEEPEDATGYLGMAFKLEDDVFERCCSLLNRVNPPRNAPTAPAQPSTDYAELYEELRQAIDGGSESMTHKDALEAVRYWQDRVSALETHNTMLRVCLKNVIKVADRKTDEFDAARAALRETK